MVGKKGKDTTERAVHLGSKEGEKKSINFDKVRLLFLKIASSSSSSFLF